MVWGIDWAHVKYMNDYYWTLYTYYVLVGLLGVAFFYRLFNPIDYEKVLDKKFKKPFLDKIITLISCYSIIYYILDSAFLIILGRWRYPCAASFILHHAFSAMILPFAVSVPYWTWFWIGPGFVHCLLLVFPQYEWMNYIYLLSIFCFQFGMYATPLKDLLQYKVMRYGITMIEIVVIPLWWFECSNALPAPIA